jgi:aminoglycoside 2'-N-acetyltransferase I
VRTRLVTTGDAAGDLLAEIRDLLDEAFGGEFSDEDWDHALGGWHVVVLDGGRAVSHAAVVPRVLEVAGRPFATGYVEGVGTRPGREREGLASLALSSLDPLIRSNFELGALSTGTHGLYEGLGWERWRGPTFARYGSRLVRTEDDDDGLMVLRFGSSLDVDLAAPIVCEARAGDDW